MAVFEDARPRGFAFPLGGTRPPAVDSPAGRRAARSSVAIRIAIAPRVGPLGTALGAIVLLFLVGFLWLAQSVRVSATSYDIVRLASQHDRLNALSRDLESDLSRLSGQPAVRKFALDAGYGQLGAPVVLPAR